MSDKNCPYTKFLGEDLTRVPIGKDYCTSNLRGRERGEFGEEQDYFECNCDNHEKCFWFLNESKLGKILVK